MLLFSDSSVLCFFGALIGDFIVSVIAYLMASNDGERNPLTIEEFENERNTPEARRAFYF